MIWKIFQDRTYAERMFLWTPTTICCGLAVPPPGNLVAVRKSCMNFSRPHPVSVRHAQPGHGVQCRTADVGLGALGVEAAGLERIPEQGLEPEHGRLGQTAPMVATLRVPLRQTALSEPLQNAGTRMHRAVGLRGPGVRIPAGRNSRLRPALRDRLMAGSGVLSAISPDLLDRLWDLRPQFRQPLPVTHGVRGSQRRHEGLRRLIDRHMKLTPRPALAGAGLAHFPFALTEHLQTCGIHHYMARTGAHRAGNTYLQRRLPAATGA